MELNRTTGHTSGWLHVATAFDLQRGIVSFYCESHPLTTVRNYGLPVRCPFCRQPRPGGGEHEFGRDPGVRKPQH